MRQRRRGGPVAYDTRDFEPDPNSGVFIELTSELAGKFSLSEYDWARITLSPRAYYSPFPKLADVVVAGRLLGSVQSAGTPFFEMNQLSFADYDRPGLGGLRTLRGFKQDRFVGGVVALATLEVRWTFYEFNIKQQHFGLMLAPFLRSPTLRFVVSATGRAPDFASPGTRRPSSSSTTA